MSDLSELEDQTLYEQARGLNDKAALNLNSASPETLLLILDAMRVYCLTERRFIAFQDEYSDIMSSIARKLNRSVW